MIGEIINMFKIEGVTHALYHNSKEDSRVIRAITSDVNLVTFDSSLNVIGKNNILFGTLRIERIQDSKQVIWNLFKNGTAVLTGGFNTRNQSKTDLDWHYLDIEDAEIECFKELVKNGTISI